MNRYLLPGIKSRKGFTLIELLVAAAIIGVLVSVIVVNFNTSRLKARNAQRISDLQKVQLALEEYYDDHGYYPRCDSGAGSTRDTTGSSQSQTDLPGADVCDDQFPEGNFGDFKDLGLDGYIRSVPSDPLDGTSQGLAYFYCYQRGYRKTGDATYIATQSIKDYILAARLEDASYSGYGTPAGNNFTACGNLYKNILLGN